MKRSMVVLLISIIIIINAVIITAAVTDVNNDGVTNRKDISDLVPYYRGVYNATFDVNSDGVVDLFDIVIIAKNVTLSGGTSLFFDGFESADMSTTNTDGFSWGSNNRGSIVTMLDGVPTAVYNNGVISNPGPQGRDWNPHDGLYSFRFRYPAGINSWAEQRFDLGAAHKDIWFRYWLRVPTNFEHRSGEPLGKASNNKFFALWMDGDQSKGDGSTVIWQFRPDGSNGSVVLFSSGPGQFTGTGGEKQYTPFISSPADQGRWMQVVLHVKAATNRTSNDGVIELWRRWNGEQSFTKLHEALNVDIAPPPGGLDGWKAGYVMGWSNPGYDVNTEWLMDEFTISNTSLLGV